MEPFMELSGSKRQFRVDVTDRKSRILSALRAHENSSWGRATEDSDQAAGLCKRASLVLLELLRREGVEDAELWHLGMPKEGSGFAPGDEHYFVVIGEEAIDATARQFDRTGDPITRRSLREVAASWHGVQLVRIGYVEPLIGKDLHDIPDNWRQLADVDPPGDAIGWPYPGPWPTDRRGPAGVC
jgi:hypothetical protein